jgi:hypothetical protein
MKKVSPLDEFTRDEPVSLDRVNKFAELSRAQQLDVLTTLRGQGMQDNFELPLFAIVIPIIVTLGIGFTDIRPLTGPIWANTVALGVFGFLMAIGIGLVVGVPLLLREMRRKSAVTLLGAYEDELVRRRAMRGGEGRRWRRTH